MNHLVVCLGYDLNVNGSVTSVLKSRLDDSIKLLRGDSKARLLLMGARSYREGIPDSLTQASAMQLYVAHFAPDISANRIMKEESSTSSVEQIYALREFSLTYDLTIVASDYFVETIKLYARYMLPGCAITYVASVLPEDRKSAFEQAEQIKLKTAKAWLGKHKAGDAEIILREQKVFQVSVKDGAKNHPHGWVSHPRS